MSWPEKLQPIPLPVIGAPLFIVSNPELVIAQCKNGIIGAFPALNARPQALLGSWLAKITSELEAFRQANPSAEVAPFAVNQIIHSSNDRLPHVGRGGVDDGQIVAAGLTRRCYKESPILPSCSAQEEPWRDR
jgi:NAD(P)H-dependent flavin oxidoreductase YrpB (nitropropane dioxygenase family)